VAIAAPVRQPPRLSSGGPSYERQLFLRYRDGDYAARDQLACHFMRLARTLAARYHNSGEAREDLQQVACVGLLKAIDRYDPGLGPFVPFALPNILGELKRHFRDHGWTVQVPRPLQQRYLEVTRVSDMLVGRLGRSPSPRDIAEHTAYTIEEVAEALEAGSAYSPAALDAPRSVDGDGTATLGDQIGADDAHFALIDDGTVIAPTFRALPEREQLILHMRFIEDLTQGEIAERIGISQMHVSRLLRRALDKLNATAAAAAA